MRRLWFLCLLAATTLPAPSMGQDQIIDSWLLHGPIPSDTGESGLVFDHIGGEHSLMPTAGELWTEITGDSLGRVRLNEIFEEQAEWSVAYAHTYVLSPEDRNIQLDVPSDTCAHA